MREVARVVAAVSSALKNEGVESLSREPGAEKARTASDAALKHQLFLKKGAKHDVAIIVDVYLEALHPGRDRNLDRAGCPVLCY